MATLADLLTMLEEIAQELEINGVDASDVEVSIAYQPSYPLYAPMGEAVLVDENAPDAETMAEFDEDLEEMDPEERKAAWEELNAADKKYRVYVGVSGWGGDSGYLSGPARDVLGW